MIHSAARASDAVRWEAVIARDRRAAEFVYGVRSTGVYCRPGCPSRRPRRDRVEFFDRPSDAEQAGFRACLRCRPAAGATPDPWTDRITRACDFLAKAERPTLAALARQVGGSRYHLQRNFKRLVGLTPRQYAEACRLDAVKRRLRRGEAVTTALFEAGYGSSRRFYERAAPKLAMRPAMYRAGAVGVPIDFTIADSPAGRLLVAATPRGICSVALGSSDDELRAALTREYPRARIARADSRLAAWTRQIVASLEGRQPRRDLPLEIKATAFQWQVWLALTRIPYGETRTYKEVAAAIGRPAAVRAVARACAANPVAIAVPCHRVVPAAGGRGGYRWGASRKQAILAAERRRRPVD